MNIINRIYQLSLCVLLLSSAAVQAQSLPDFTSLVENNVGAIVNVTTSSAGSAISDEQREYLDEFLRFFGEQGNELEMPPADELRPGASGSGFIIDAEGYIVTNHHVVEGSDEITITLNDQREYTATLIGSDPSSDLALLKIEGGDLPTVKMGQSSSLKVGEWVLAIGSPFGLQYSVSAGIISYMGRSLPTGGTRYVSYIQTDVAINPGHSGGPLLNLAGEVIGINSQIFTNSGGSIGLSFAIPVDVARNVIGQLRDNGSVQRGWLGVSYQDVSPQQAEAFSLDTPHGALINKVEPGSPADKAGLQAGDIVVEVDGEHVRTGADLPYFVGLRMPGAEISLDIIRAREALSLPLTLGTRENLSTATETVQETNRLGLTVRALEPAEKLELGIESGVMVEKVEGAAATANIQVGDVLLSLNSVELSSPAALDLVAAELPVDKAIPVLVARGRAQSFFTLRISE